MVDIIGPAANQIATSLTGTKGMDSVRSEREKPSLNAPSSPEAVDEVSISNEAMDIGRVMEVVQEAKARVESMPNVTLSDNPERLDTLV